MTLKGPIKTQNSRELERQYSMQGRRKSFRFNSVQFLAPHMVTTHPQKWYRSTAKCNPKQTQKSRKD